MMECWQLSFVIRELVDWWMYHGWVFGNFPKGVSKALIFNLGTELGTYKPACMFLFFTPKFITLGMISPVAQQVDTCWFSNSQLVSSSSSKLSLASPWPDQVASALCLHTCACVYTVGIYSWINCSVHVCMSSFLRWQGRLDYTFISSLLWHIISTEYRNIIQWSDSEWNFIKYNFSNGPYDWVKTCPSSLLVVLSLI